MTVPLVKEPQKTFRTRAELEAHTAELETEMRQAAANLEFERAAQLRDRVKELKQRQLGVG